MMKTIFFTLLFSLLIASVSPPIFGYTVGSGFGDPCHELITGRSFIDVIKQYGDQAEGQFPVPSGEVWQSLSRYIMDALGVDDSELSKMQRFILISFILGVRAPDTDGHSVTNLESMESIHGDPSDESQYAHALRGMDDDYAQGDINAIEGVRTTIKNLMIKAKDLIDSGESKNLITTHIYMDFYGRLPVEVFGPVFYAGMALHAVQDSFSHTIRDDASNLRKIVHVLNYIEAISTKFDEERDGLAHSDSMDECLRPEAADLTAVAQEATKEFSFVVNNYFSQGDEEGLDIFLDEWITLKPGCTIEDEFCGNGRWLALVRTKQTGPYVREFLGCQSVPGRTRPIIPGFILLLLGSALVFRKVKIF
jgi:hypothetical protein